MWFVELRIAGVQSTVVTEEGVGILGAAVLNDLLEHVALDLHTFVVSVEEGAAGMVCVIVVLTTEASGTDIEHASTVGTTADAGTDGEHLVFVQDEEAAERLVVVFAETVENLGMSGKEVLHLLFCDGAMGENAQGVEMALVLSFLPKVLTEVALGGVDDTTTADRTAALEVVAFQFDGDTTGGEDETAIVMLASMLGEQQPPGAAFIT